jgi:hypothetical protein
MRPHDFRTALEECEVNVTKMIGKGKVLTPLVLPMEKPYLEKYDRGLYEHLER